LRKSDELKDASQSQLLDLQSTGHSLLHFAYPTGRMTPGIVWSHRASKGGIVAIFDDDLRAPEALTGEPGSP
jgi:hypothetical protein